MGFVKLINKIYQDQGARIQTTMKCRVGRTGKVNIEIIVLARGVEWISSEAPRRRSTI